MRWLWRTRRCQPDLQRSRKLIIEMLEDRHVLALSPLQELVPVPAIGGVAPMTTRAVDSAPIVNRTQTIGYDLSSRVERVFSPAESALPQTELDSILSDSLQRQGFASWHEFAASLGSPAGMFQYTAMASAPVTSSSGEISGWQQTETVHGNDDRTLVTSTTTYPFRAVAESISRFPHLRDLAQEL